MALTGVGVLTSVITTVIFIFVNALLLMLATKIFKLRDTSYKTALWITAVLGVVGFVVGLLAGLLPTIAGILSMLLVWVVVGILLAMYLIKIKYNLDWGKAALVWVVFFVFELIASFIIGAILIFVFIALGLGMGMAAGVPMM